MGVAAAAVIGTLSNVGIGLGVSGAASTGVTAGVGAAAVAGAAYAGYETATHYKDKMKDAMRGGGAAGDQSFEFPEIEIPEMSFDLAKPDVPKPPPPPKPRVGQADAAQRATSEADKARSRRRALSLFSDSPERAGRASTILTSSVGAPGTPPVRRRVLGGTDTLLGGTA